VTANTIINNTFRKYFARFAENSGLIKFPGVPLIQTSKTTLVMGVGRIFPREGNSGFFRGGIKMVKFYFTHSKLRKKTFSAENIIARQISKSR